MKKILALVVAFALCFTAVAGCITTSAEDANPTISIEVNEVASNGGATFFTVSGKDYGTVAAQRLTVTIAKDVTLDSIYDGETQLVGATDNADYYVTVGENETVVDIFSVFNIGDVSRDAFSFTFNVKVPENTTEIDATYNVKADVAAANNDEQHVIIDSDSADITVKAPVAEPEVCEHANWTAWNITQPTKTETGLKTRTCLDCGEATEEVVISVPVKDNVTFNYSMNIQDSLGISYNLKKSNVTNPNYKTLEFVSSAKKYNEQRNFETTPEAPISRKDLTSYYVGIYSGIAMYELDLPISTYIKYYDADGIFVAYSETVTKSPLELMKEKYATSSEKSQRLTSDMLNLGAAAQTYFGALAAGSDLSKAELVNSDPTYTSKATTGDITGLTVVKNPDWADNSPLAESAFKATLNYAGTPTLGFTITKDPTWNDDDFELEVSYNAVIPTAFAGPRSVTVGANGDEAWKTVTSGKYLSYAFSKITLADSNQIVTATLKYQGETVCTLAITMEAVINDKLSGSGNSLALSQALARFGASARNYFA